MGFERLLIFGDVEEFVSSVGGVSFVRENGKI